MTTDFDEYFHYPAELVELLTDTIARIIRSKPGVLDLFRNVGVGPGILREWDDRVAADASAVRKREIARAVLIRINQAGDRGLRARRALIRRIAEWEDFSTCWDADRLPAQGLVAQVRSAVDRHDSFVRINQERERERAARILVREENARKIADERSEREELRKLLGNLFTLPNPWERGKRLEPILNGLFAHYRIAIRESFTVRGDAGEGVVEQIDGVISLDGRLYLVEMKWHAEALGVADVAQALVRAFNRADVRSLIISQSGFSDPAVAQCRTALTNKIVVLAELREVVSLLDSERNLTDWLRTKVEAAELDGQPLKLEL